MGFMSYLATVSWIFRSCLSLRQTHHRRKSITSCLRKGSLKCLFFRQTPPGAALEAEILAHVLRNRYHVFDIKKFLDDNLDIVSSLMNMPPHLYEHGMDGPGG